MSNSLTESMDRRRGIVTLINVERARQDSKWGFPQRMTFAEWGNILAEEAGELCKELNDLNFGSGDRVKLTDEAIHVAAVAIAILEHIETADNETAILQGFRRRRAEREVQ